MKAQLTQWEEASAVMHPMPDSCFGVPVQTSKASISPGSVGWLQPFLGGLANQLVICGTPQVIVRAK